MIWQNCGQLCGDVPKHGCKNGCWFVGTHINAWCRRVKLFSRNGVVSGNGRLHTESGKQKRLLKFPLHLCSPAGGQKHTAHQED